MATADEKLKIAIDVQIKNAGQVTKLKKELKALGGEAAVKSARELKKLQREIKLVGGESKKSAPLISKLNISIAKGILIAKGAELAMVGFKNAIREVIEATVVAGEVQELGNVYEFIGERAGYSTTELRKFNLVLRGSGIAQKESNKALLRGLQAQIDLTDVVKLAGVAQDAAVVAQTDSSEAHIDLMDAVVKLRPMLLKKFGIIVNLKEVYPKYAKSIGKSTAELTANEKRAALLNEIYKQGLTLTGAYGKSMESASKRMRSLNRLFQDAQVAVGGLFQDEFRFAVDITGTLLKKITSLAESTQQATEKFFALQLKTKGANEQALILANRYDELIKKTNLTAQEQHELNGLVDRLGTIMPTAIDGWNSYGKAVSLSTKAIRGNITAERALANLQLVKIVDEYKQQWGKLLAVIIKTEKEIKTKTTPTLTTMGLRLVHSGRSAKEAKEAFVELKEEQQEMIATLSLGFDALNNYDSVAKILGTDLAILVALYQRAEQGQKGYTQAIVDGAEAAKKARPALFTESADVFNIEDVMKDVKVPDDQVKVFRDKYPAALDRTTQGFRGMASAAQQFYNVIAGGKLTFGSFLNLAFQLSGLFSGLGLLGGAGSAVSAVTGGGGVGSLGGVTPVAPNIPTGGNITIVTQANNATAVAREIENLSGRNYTSIQTSGQRIVR